MTRRLRGPVVALTMVLLGACGATSRSGDVAVERASWTAAELRKLDPELRAQVRDEDRVEPLAVKVFFYELPSDGELSELRLARLGGHHAIGQLGPAALQRIASRGDVERIEALNDVGYELK